MTVLVTPWADHLALDAATFDQHPDNDAFVFPGGEVYVQLADVASMEQATVVHSGWKPNAGLQFLYGALDLLRAHDVETTVLFTYMPYSRQDAAFYERAVNQAQAVLRKLAAYYGVEQVIGIDAHFAHRAWVDDSPFMNVHVFEQVQQAVDMEDYVVIGPDAGAADRFGITGLAKERQNAYDVAVSGDVDVAGRNVLLFDDIIATGETMVSAYNSLKEQGAATVAAAAVHGVMADGVDRVNRTFDDLFLTNTIPRDAANVRIEPVIREHCQ